MEAREKIDAIHNAREVLRNAGFFVDELWHVNDVKLIFNVTDDKDAQTILKEALTNDWVMEQIHYGIRDTAEEKGFTKLEEDED